MTIERYRHRRTVGSGPPKDLTFGEIAYSDADGLLHVGRPDGSARSFAQPSPLLWENIGNRPNTYPPSTHTHNWGQITNPPATYPPSTHTHTSTTINLSPQNGFVPVVAESNKLEVYPGDKKCLIVFSVSRTSIPAGGTPLFGWDPAYTPKFPNRANVRGVQFTPTLAKDDVQLVLSGPNLLFYSLGGDAVNYGLLDGFIVFSYV